jgi:hypothetical protein
VLAEEFLDLASEADEPALIRIDPQLVSVKVALESADCVAHVRQVPFAPLRDILECCAHFAAIPGRKSVNFGYLVSTHAIFRVKTRRHSGLCANGVDGIGDFPPKAVIGRRHIRWCNLRSILGSAKHTDPIQYHAEIIDRLAQPGKRCFNPFFLPAHQSNNHGRSLLTDLPTDIPQATATPISAALAPIRVCHGRSADQNPRASISEKIGPLIPSHAVKTTASAKQANTTRSRGMRGMVERCLVGAAVSSGPPRVSTGFPKRLFVESASRSTTGAAEWRRGGTMTNVGLAIKAAVKRAEEHERLATRTLRIRIMTRWGGDRDHRTGVTPAGCDPPIGLLIRAHFVARNDDELKAQMPDYRGYHSERLVRWEELDQRANELVALVDECVTAAEAAVGILAST